VVVVRLSLSTVGHLTAGGALFYFTAVDISGRRVFENNPGNARRRRSDEARLGPDVMGGLVRNRLGMALCQKARRGDHARGEVLSPDGITAHPRCAACA